MYVWAWALVNSLCGSATCVPATLDTSSPALLHTHPAHAATTQATLVDSAPERLRTSGSGWSVTESSHCQCPGGAVNWPPFRLGRSAPFVLDSANAVTKQLSIHHQPHPWALMQDAASSHHFFPSAASAPLTRVSHKDNSALISFSTVNARREKVLAAVD